MPFRMKFRNLTYCDQHVTTGTVTGVPSMIPKNDVKQKSGSGNICNWVINLA